ncbi:hypothetical protein PGTUg99_023611 [Puccinia graminis f. sp. tritici]|uniref:MULE transposase domain-containing protein n=1 Tax=Puccinia graminis f. sp. tritici TaxID=56615 RepID=A0A5B0M7Z0_PUCGR|nr:hypothetical protein PGTUg99_023611 [Puccinia graminis f. sp. tritici]
MSLRRPPNQLIHYCHQGPGGRKGPPICWAFTASAAAEPIGSIFKWLRKSTGVIPCAIMSDCALAIKKGVNLAYEDLGRQAPHIYWCLFHVLKAFRNRARDFLKDESPAAIEEFWQIVYDLQDPEGKMHLFYDKWSPINKDFGNYAQTQWHTNILHWATPHQGIHTNNYTKAWHRILKSHFIVNCEGRRRIDEVVQIMVDQVHTSYVMTQLQVEEGLKSQRPNKFQSLAKAKAKGYTPTILELLGIVVTPIEAGVSNILIALVLHIN